MSDKPDKNESEEVESESFADLFEAYGAVEHTDFRQGDKIEGTIISIGKDTVYVSLGSKSDGVIDKSELMDENGEIPYHPGDVLELYVISQNESEILLSKALSGQGNAELLQEAAHTRTPVEGKVTGTVKGGFSLEIMGKRAFCPISQIDIPYVETPEDYVGNTHHFVITRYAEGGRNIVVSRKELLLEAINAKKKEFFKDLAVGDIREGTVTKLMKFGAFIELIPGVEGMAHISELSWSRVDDPGEVVKSGDVVQVKVLAIETDKSGQPSKLSLSLKQTSADPWDTAMDRLKSGDQLTGKVVRLAPFGAFVELFPGLDGLVHISEMSHIKRVVRPDDVVSQGEMVQVIVKSVDLENKRISLSIKDAKGDPWDGAALTFKPGSRLKGKVEKRERYGIFIQVKEGVTGLMPSSFFSRSQNPSQFDSVKPGDTIDVVVEEVHEEDRKMTLIPAELKETDDWKEYSKPQSESLGSMGALLMEALKKKG